MADEIKNNRAKAKRAVTNGIRKLKSMIFLNREEIELKQQEKTLESLFDELNMLHLEYEDFTGEQDGEYLNEITQMYDSTMRECSGTIIANDKIRQIQEIEVIKKRVEKHFSRLTNCLNNIQDNSQPDVSDIHTLEEDEKTANTILGKVSEDIEKLSHFSEFTENEYFQTEMSRMSDAIFDACRSAKIQVRKSSSTNLQNTSISIINDTTNSQKSSQHQIKKIDLPCFNGDRRQWPEFKAMFKHFAESVYSTDEALAYELKRHIKPPADSLVQSIYCTKPGAYNIMWKKLGDVFDDPGASVSSALNTIYTLKRPGEDYKSLVFFINEVESVFAQLEQLNQLNSVSVRDIDYLNSLMPINIKMEWNRLYSKLPSSEKLEPFISFMKYLEAERSAMARVADTITLPRQPRRLTLIGMADSTQCCILHQSSGHSTKECRNFLRKSTKEKYEILRKEKLCFKCFSQHGRDNCTETNCENCGRSHNIILCSRAPPTFQQSYNQEPQQNFFSNSVPGRNHTANPFILPENETGHQSANSMTALAEPCALLPIAKVSMHKIKSQPLTLFDSGSDASYITHSFAHKAGLKCCRKVQLDVTTMGNVITSIHTSVYAVPIKALDGELIIIEAFGLKQITGEVSKLDSSLLEELFPSYDCTNLQRADSEIDLLIGMDNFGLHPKREVARAGKNLSIMSGKLCICLQGTHEKLKEKTRASMHCIKLLHGSQLKSIGHTFTATTRVHPIFNNPQIAKCNQICKQQDTSEKVHLTSLTSIGNESKIEKFITGEELGTTVNPKCGSCRCGKCPQIGYSYSFLEEQELNMIVSGLKYDEQGKHWVASYPWLVDPKKLPNNIAPNRSRLFKLERSLQQDPEKAAAYEEQINDMIQRGVARLISEQELKEWDGPFFYIHHLAVLNPKSSSTPVRIVFNSSMTYKGISLNSCLAKGPDTYTNNILGILMRWREGKVAMVADIRKMFHSIFLEEKEVHCHRFLWRHLDTTKEPDTYAITRVNMGDRPASAIATEALKATAELSRNDYPEAAELITRCSYMDDLIDSTSSTEKATQLAKDVNTVLQKGGFMIKCWQFSGDDSAKDADGVKQITSLLKGSTNETCVLGTNWNPIKDEITFHIESNILIEKIPKTPSDILTRRKVLQIVMSVYDPMGILSPFILKAKVLLRKTWELRLGWDDQLPTEMQESWKRFFNNLSKIENIKLSRSLTPPDTVGDPWLILFSDGSETAYGFVGYIRWKLTNGSYWCRLIMSKSRIAPLHKVTIPRMELNAAVLSKRGKQVIQNEMRIKFAKVIHLIDSLTVLNMLHKTSTRFQIYEGSRIGEIQADADGDMKDWAWIPGQNNIADHLTRGLEPEDITNESQWWNGPKMLYDDYESWNIKLGKQNDDSLPGEKICMAGRVKIHNQFQMNLENFSNIKTARIALARVLGILKCRSFSGGCSSNLTPELLKQADLIFVKAAQTEFELDQKSMAKRFKYLNPVKNEENIWIVGVRMARFNPLSYGGKPQMLLPTTNTLTNLLMKEAHEKGHLGKDATLAKFRESYWTPHGDKVAKSIKNKCQTCKLRSPILNSQCMGQLPISRLKPSTPFNHTMIDFMGPFLVRGEVQKRISGKCYFVLFTDLVARAIHIECVFGYDTNNFMLALTRFVSIRGWPSCIYSDQGPQLEAVGKEMKEIWTKIDKCILIKEGAQAGTTWTFGPADSPWHQGAAEALVKTVKKCLQFSIHSQRLSPSEYMTAAYDIANTINERPIGYKPSADSNINILTPNCLLIGRSSAKNPGDWLQESGKLKTRLEVVSNIANQFWRRWSELYAPSLIRQLKWNKPFKNIEPGDVVLMCDKNQFKGQYKLARVKEVFPGPDGYVRKVTLAYKNTRPGEPLSKYMGAPDTIVTRAIQRIALLVPLNDE